MSSRPPKFEFRAYPPAKVAKVANFVVGENQASQLSQVSQARETEPIFFAPEEKGTRGRCVECPWCQDNPWTHYPEFPRWCSWHFDYLAADSQQCLGWRKREIPQPDLRKTPWSHDFTLANNEGGGSTKGNTPQEQVTCFQCRQFKPNDGPNPRQEWGWCLKRGRGRYGCATACEAAVTDNVAGWNANP